MSPTGPKRAAPHSFGWVFAAALALALLAAALAPDRAPAIALYWNPVYRAEIGLVTFAIAYLLAVSGWMAWHGHAFKRIELPGGPALERDAEELDAAATDFSGFQDSVVARLDAVEAALEGVVGRVERLEDRGGTPRDPG